MSLLDFGIIFVLFICFLMNVVGGIGVRLSVGGELFFVITCCGIWFDRGEILYNHEVVLLLHLIIEDSIILTQTGRPRLEFLGSCRPF